MKTLVLLLQSAVAGACVVAEHVRRDAEEVGHFSDVVLTSRQQLGLLGADGEALELHAVLQQGDLSARQCQRHFTTTPSAPSESETHAG